ncbi:MAG: hypothetical protein AAGD38_07870 [Acidobacteriota bacterium]
MRRVVLALFVGLMALPLMVTGSEEKTLVGEYVWTERGVSDELKAVFVATGENTWDVSFNFDFRNKPYIYKGTATGNLTSGKVEGTVLNDTEKRTFTFSGEFVDGVLKGTHRETTEGRERQTGTFSLGAPVDAL